jgi:SagB-type dehydrogenase family enzyme
MTDAKWQELCFPSKSDNETWELFHENSKTGKLDDFLPQESIRARMNALLESLPYNLYPEIPLPTPPAALSRPIGEVLLSRVTARTLKRVPLGLEQIGAILHYSYGLTRDNKDTVFPRPFRVVPSGGALYPLEIFLHSSNGNELEAGLYHYDPLRNSLRLLVDGDMSRKISEAMVQREVAMDISMTVFITAMFERSTFKYGNRGYRFVFLEAGHVAQNMNLTATALGLGCVNIGGFFDADIDALLGLDGLTHSTIYMQGIGLRVEGEEEFAVLS